MRLNLVLVICVAQAGGLSGGKLTSLDNLDQITFPHIYLLQAFTLDHIEFCKWPHGATITAMHLDIQDIRTADTDEANFPVLAVGWPD